jgi:hypothetical protein
LVNGGQGVSTAPHGLPLPGRNRGTRRRHQVLGRESAAAFDPKATVLDDAVILFIGSNLPEKLLVDT